MARTRVTGRLDKRATHQRNVTTKDANGGDVAAWSTIASDVPVSVEGIDTELRNDYAQRRIVVTHGIITDSDIGVRAQDRLVINGVNYVVHGLDPAGNSHFANYVSYMMHCQQQI